MKKILFTLLILTTPLVANDKLSLMTIRGEATLSKPADQVALNIGVVTQAKTAEAALSENSQKMAQVIEEMKTVGLEKGDFQTGRFNIRPVQDQRPRQADPEWQPTIIAYEVTNSLNIETQKIDLIGTIIDRVTKMGVNSIDNIRFSIKDPRQYRPEAIQAATKAAMDDANTLSSAAGVEIVGVHSLNLDAINAVPRGPYMVKAMAMEAAPIISGDVDVTVSVTVQFEIN